MAKRTPRSSRRRVTGSRTPAPKAPAQRTDALIEEAIEWIANGKTLSDFCRQPGRPDRRTITRWIADDDDLVRRFTLARELGYDELAEEALRRADEPISLGPDGRIDPGVVQLRRLQIDTRLRLLAKWSSARYGDKVQVGGDAANPLRVEHALTDEQRLARMQALLATARERREKSGLSQAQHLPTSAETRDHETAEC